MTERPKPGAITANLACFSAMIMWAVGFPAGEVLLQSWGAITLLLARYVLSVGVLVVLWFFADGLTALVRASWSRGFVVGGLGFGVGGLLLLVGQKLSDPVTPAIAAATMPVVGAVLEVLFDKRKLRLNLVIGMGLAIGGGYIATGVNLSDGSFGLGALLCLMAVVLFAWGTRATTESFPDLSPIGQTTVTLAGAMMFLPLAYICAIFSGSRKRIRGPLTGTASG